MLAEVQAPSKGDVCNLIFEKALDIEKRQFTSLTNCSCRNLKDGDVVSRFLHGVVFILLYGQLLKK